MQKEILKIIEKMFAENTVTLKQSLNAELKTTVNGKIDALHREFVIHKDEEHKWQADIKEHLERQDGKLDALMVETAPIIESKNTLVGLRKFLLWVAAPAGIVWAVWNYLIDKIR